MASITLHDSTMMPTHTEVGSELTHAKKCVTVLLLDPDPALHQRACEAVLEKAWATAEHMLSAVLSRAFVHTNAIIFALPPFDTSNMLLQPLLPTLTRQSSTPAASAAEAAVSSSSSLPSLSRGSPLKIHNRGYSADATCRSVQTLIELGDAARAFEKLEKRFNEYVTHIIGLLEATCGEDTEGDRTFLRLSHAWGHYRLAIVELQEVWVFLDRCHSRRERTMSSIESLAMPIMRQALLLHPWLLPRAQAGFLMCLQLDLEHARDTRRELRLFTDLCIVAEVYNTRLEPEILVVVSKFYKAMTKRMWRDGVRAGAFFQQVDTYLKENRHRVEAFLHPKSLPGLEEAVQRSMLLDHGIDFLRLDFGQLTKEAACDGLRLAWRLLALGDYVHLAKECGVVFRRYIAVKGAAVMREVATKPVDAGEWSAVKAMIELKRCGERVIHEGFAGDSLFFVQLRAALTEALQEHQAEFAEQLARYLDYVIREGPDDTLALMNNRSNTTNHYTTTTAEDDDDDADGASCAVSYSTVPISSPNTTIGGAMRSAATPTTSGYLSEVLKDIVSIYALIPSKDVFEAFYWRDLAYRLLHHQQTPRLEVEESFIQFLKEMCGVETSRFEGMLGDLKGSGDLNERYRGWVDERNAGAPKPRPPRMEIENEEEEKQQHEEGGEEAPAVEAGEEESAATVMAALSSVEVKLHILTDAYWPRQTPLELRLPPPLCTLAKCVQDFYRHCFTDRRLLWQHQLSSAVVTYTFGAVRRQLTGTLLQASMLLVLQDMMDTARQEGHPFSPTVGVLCERLAVDISLPDVVGAVLGLCHPKFRLLLREPATRGTDSGSEAVGNAGAMSLSADDQLLLNDEFTFGAMRRRIPFFTARRRRDSAAEGRADDESKRTSDGILVERSHVIEAAVVRLMKKKRCVSHEELVETIPTLLRFPVMTATLKKAIERLIERGFLERSGATAYRYLS
ncbi:putative cullin 4B [Trypanosoma grayi]|uniref:putative cullin 4B n=1 Tax=Trypanosoma grayi TaxID=71804 RepID=UPI0004F4B703|nr:putative cullin 4B [Trypanosoma grayi]KEG07843.1 putative cullin 4B [Trypanosoma grayi]